MSEWQARADCPVTGRNGFLVDVGGVLYRGADLLTVTAGDGHIATVDGNIMPRLGIYDPSLDTWTTVDTTVAFVRIQAVAIGTVLWLSGRLAWRDGAMITQVDVGDSSDYQWGVLPYDTTNNTAGTLRIKPDAQEPRMPSLDGIGSCAAVGNLIYFYADADGVDPLPRPLLWVYDTVNDTWSTTAAVPGPSDTQIPGSRRLVTDGTNIYAVEGKIDRGSPNGVIDVYTPATDSWASTDPDPTPRSGSAVVLNEGKIWVTGGYDAAGASAAVTSYDIAGGTWATETSLVDPRYATTGGVTGANIYVVGGNNYPTIDEASLLMLSQTNTPNLTGALRLGRTLFTPV